MNGSLHTPFLILDLQFIFQVNYGTVDEPEPAHLICTLNQLNEQCTRVHMP